MVGVDGDGVKGGRTSGTRYDLRAHGNGCQSWQADDLAPSVDRACARYQMDGDKDVSPREGEPWGWRRYEHNWPSEKNMDKTPQSLQRVVLIHG